MLEGEAPASATALVGELQVFIPLAGLIDLDAEKARLAKELKRIEAEIGKCRGKLASDTFVANAPPRDIDERELQERNAAYFRAYQYAALMLLVGYICSDLLGKVFGGLMMSGELVADYMRVALISSLIMPATVLAWRDRGEEDPG